MADGSDGDDNFEDALENLEMSPSEKAVETCYINDFPDELIIKIFCFLSPYDQTSNVRLVCKRWLGLITEFENLNTDMFVHALKTHSIVWHPRKPQIDQQKAELDPNAEEPPLLSPSKRFSHCVCVHNHIMYVFGGACADPASSVTYNDMYALDMSTYQWSKIEPQGLLPAPREAATFIGYKDVIFLHGGMCRPPFERAHIMGPRFFDDTQIFNLKTQRWKKYEYEEMYPSARSSEGASIVRNLVVTFGGVHRNNELNDIWQYNMDTFEWKMNRVRTQRPPERFGTAQFTISEDRIMIYGGTRGADKTLSDVWLLDTNKWYWTEVRVDNIPSEPTRSWCHPPILTNGHIVVFSDDKLCQYCGNFIHSKEYTLPTAAPEPGAELCTCGRKMSELNPEHLERHVEYKVPVYTQMYVMDCSNVLTGGPCKWYDYNPVPSLPMSMRHSSVCAGVNEIFLFGGVEETAPHNVNDTLYILNAKATGNV